MTTNKINTYDIDGVIFMGDEYEGVTPRPQDIIITGRSYEEAAETEAMLKSRGIDKNVIYYAPWPFNEKTREKSGHHKGIVLSILKRNGVNVGIHFEDDPIQATIIKAYHNPVVLLSHNLVEKENVRHYFVGDSDAPL